MKKGVSYILVLMTLSCLMSGAVFGDTIYVATDGNDVTGDGSSGKPYKTIQKGIDEASSGDTVEVADGTYTGTGNKDLDFGGLDITVQSANGAENCIIDCEGSGRGFYFHTSEDADSIVSGFTIENGNSAGGGGVYCNATSPVIANCIIRNCTSSSYGGGLWCGGPGEPLIRGCLIYGNSASYGGGGVGRNVGNLEMVNCTVVKNTANSGGGYWYYNSSPEVVNCVIWGNSASSAGDQVYNNGYSFPTYSYCALEGCGGSGDNWSSDFDGLPSGNGDGGGNIDSYPFFNDWDANDFHLTLNSPCINRGDLEGSYSELTDIDGQQRAMDSRVDIGADELERNINLISNGGFETWASGLPTSWTATGSIDVDIIANGYDGNSVELHNGSTSDQQYIYQDFGNIYAGNPYVISTMSNTNQTGKVFVVDTDWKDSGGSVVGKAFGVTYPAGIDAWREKTVLWRFAETDDYGESTADHDWILRLYAEPWTTVAYDNVSVGLGTEFLPPYGVEHSDDANSIDFGGAETYISWVDDYDDPSVMSGKLSDGNDSNITYRELKAGKSIEISFPAFNTDTNGFLESPMLLEIMYKDVAATQGGDDWSPSDVVIVRSKLYDVNSLNPWYKRVPVYDYPISNFGGLNDGKWRYIQVPFCSNDFQLLRDIDGKFKITIDNDTDYVTPSYDIPIGYVSLRKITDAECESLKARQRSVRGFYEVELPEDEPETPPSYDDPTVFVRDVMRPVYRHTKPAENEPNSITAFSAKGTVEPLSFAMYSEGGLSDLTVIVSDLAQDGNTISANNIGIYEVIYNEAIVYATGVAMEPDYIREFDTLSIETDSSVRVWLKVSIPANQPEGLYEGTITVKQGMTTVATVDVDLTVCDFTLVDAANFNSSLYGDPFRTWDRIMADDINSVLSAYAETGLDVHRHPYDLQDYAVDLHFDTNGTLIWDSNDFEDSLDKMQEAGLAEEGTTIVLSTFPKVRDEAYKFAHGVNYVNTPDLYDKLNDEDFQDAVAEIIGRFEDIADKYDIEFVHFVVDEPGSNIQPRIYADRVCDAIHKGGGKTLITYSSECDEPITVDPNSPYHDYYLPAGMNKTLPALTEMVDHKLWVLWDAGEGYEKYINDDGDDYPCFGYYTTTSSYYSNPVYNRFLHGLYAYATDANGVGAFAMASKKVDPFNPFDGGRSYTLNTPADDYVFAYPTWEGKLLFMVGGLEAIREGVKDAQYIATLKNRIANPNNAGMNLVAGAQDYLDALKARINPDFEGAYYDNATYLGYYAPIVEDVSEDADADDYEAFSTIRQDIADYIKLIDLGTDYNVHNLTQKKWYSTIQGALDEANNSDEIVVYEGTYYETIDFNSVACTLRSTDPNDWAVVAATVIDANGAATNCVGLDASGVLSGLTIRNTGSSNYGVMSSGTSSEISNCIVEDCGCGIGVSSGSANIHNNIVRDNTSYGVYATSTGTCSTKNSMIYGNGWMGLYATCSIGTTNVLNCSIVDNNGTGIYITSYNTATIKNCIVWGHTTELNVYNPTCTVTYCCVEGGFSGTGNINSDPNFVDGANDNYHIDANCSPCIDAGAPGSYAGQVDIDGEPRVLGQYVDMGADEALPVYNVDQGKWYLTIQGALNDADANEEIVVYPGTYYENLNLSGNAVTLSSSNPNDPDVVAATVVNGYGSDAVKIYNNSVLTGLKITGGATGADVYCYAGAPVISKCVMAGCTQGVCAYGSASPDILNCKIGGVYFGVYTSSSGTTEVVNSLVYDSYALGVYSSSGTLSVTNCTIADNTSGGIYVYSGSASVTNCIVWGNGNDLYGCSATYSCIEDGDAGTGNISSDPNFVDVGNDDYRIALGSLCIDAGDPNTDSGDVGNYDLAGDDRFVDGDGQNGDEVDMGCYEYQDE